MLNTSSYSIKTLHASSPNDLPILSPLTTVMSVMQDLKEKPINLLLADCNFLKYDLCGIQNQRDEKLSSSRVTP